MVFRLLLLTLYIIQTIFFTHGQNVQTMPPQDSCVSTTITFHCPNNYIPIVRSASYGVAANAGSCSYQVGDCTADAMNIMTCLTDAVSCDIYLTRRRLPQCNDQYADYVYAEFDCVPISMTDSAKRYDVCQGSADITSDHGIIESPGYPTQFQTTTSECFRAIHVPDNKEIRLWLTDLYIGSTSTNCADDHIYVVDNIHTYRHCGNRRLAYPNLCSTTVIIQYLVTTDLSAYRGIRMYFEIVDRSPNDACPNTNGTVTPVPATTPQVTTIVPEITTPVPNYVLLGIASPVRSFQLCAGDSYQVNCPDNYVFTVITDMFGVTQTGQCDAHNAQKDCIITTEPTFMCEQTCVYIYTGHQTILACNNKTANYQYVEYQCIPTHTELISNISCPTGGSLTSIPINQRGRFQSCNYPNLQATNYTYRLTAKPGYSIHFYALDISLNGFYPGCQSNKLTLVDHDDMRSVDFCEQRSYSLIYSSCSNIVDLTYTVVNADQLFSKGAELYIQSDPRPAHLVCQKPLPTTSSPTTHPTTEFTIPTLPPSQNSSDMFAGDEVEHDVCFNEVLRGSCAAGYTFMIVNAFYGVKQQASAQCGFVQGDCVQEALATITQCYTDLPTCYILYSTKRRLANCADNYADYLHVTSQCVPSESIGERPVKLYDVCATQTDIRDIHGLITSPNFPTYKQTNDECQVKITSIQDRVLKIWINELALASGGQRHLTDDSAANEPDLVIYKNPDTNNTHGVEQMFPSIRDTCVTDYLMINTPHVVYVYCGTRKLILAPICASSVVIHYKSTSAPNLFYKGFKLYFEWVEKPMGIICGGEPQPGSTTTPGEELLPIWAQNLELSPILSEQVCLGTSKTLRCPRGSDYVLSIITSSYAVTGSGVCDIPAPTHCHQEASLSLTCTHSCLVEYIIPKPLGVCGSQDADYISISYECIPTRLPNNENPIDICAWTPSDTITLDSGMMISPQYPTLDGTRTCSKKIQTLNYKLWMVFVVDLFMQGENNAGVCNDASLAIYDGVDKIFRCGLQPPQLALISCSNIVEFQFTASHYAVGYRGFKAYFKTVDVPPGWACKPVGFTTTTMVSTHPPPTTTTLIPPSLQILTYGGTTNGTRQYCEFPFTYQGNPQMTCLNGNPPTPTPGEDVQEPWCSTTKDFDTDRQWGFCELGVTASTLFDICYNRSHEIKCPTGYVLDILTADYAATPDGGFDSSECGYHSNDCFQSDAPNIQTRCAGLPSCTIFHAGRPLSSCQNRQAAYFHIEYTCVPHDIQSINKYDMCNSGSVIQDNTRRGFISSPNFPSPTANIDCTFNIKILRPNHDIYLYIVDLDLDGPNVTGSACAGDRLIVTADATVNEICGRLYTNLLAYTCHESISLQLIRKPGARGRGVRLYFEFRDKPPFQLCPSLPTTTTIQTLSPTKPTTTTTGPLPSYFPNPSPRDVKTFCHPDMSGLMGAKNLQCPSNYVLVIQRAFYGHGPNNRCEHKAGDCIREADLVYRTCAGQQSCSISFINIVLISECNLVQANYLLVEYQCLPTPAIASNTADLCTGKIDTAGISGVLLSSQYPAYTQTQCANATLTTLASSNLVVNMYLLDMDIGGTDSPTGDCSRDYLSLSYQCNNHTYQRSLCGAHRTELLFSTCHPADQIFASYSLVSSTAQNQRGFALLYHLVPESDGFTLIPTPSRTTTTAATTRPVTPSGPGPLSTPTELTSICTQRAHTIKCEKPNYVLVIHKAQLGVSADNTCTYSTDDCFEDLTESYNHCGGKTTCDFLGTAIPIVVCNSSKANYLYIEHQCIPTHPKHHVDICSFDQSYERVQGGAIVSSLNYTSESRECIAQLRSDKLFGSVVHKAFKIYILSLNLPMRSNLREQGAQCSDQDPYIEIDDHEVSPTRLCGLSHTRYVRETCSTIIEVRFKNTILSTGPVQYKGFEIYFESIQNDECSVTLKPVIPTQPFVIENRVACASTDNRGRVDFMCTPDYGLVFLQSNYFVTVEPEKCDVTNYTCHYPSKQPQAQCSGQQGCSYTHMDSEEVEPNVCSDQRPDALEFYYQCMPMRPSLTHPKYTMCEMEYASGESGFIETPFFPNTYQHTPQQCSITIRSPDDNVARKDSIYLYAMELSIRDTTVINSSAAIKCYDSIEYTSGGDTYSLCGKIDQPTLIYHTSEKELNLTLNITFPSPTAEWSTWRGARFFYFIGNQSLPLPPGMMTTTPDVDGGSTKPTPGSGPSDLTTALIVVAVLAVVSIAVIFAVYRYRKRPKADIPTVRYGVEMDTVDGATTAEAPGKRSSIPTASLKGTSSFVTPFYPRPGMNGMDATDDETNA